MALQDAVGHVFGVDGPLSLALDGFKPRSGQTRMALAVAKTITEGGVLVAEAGTGIGKTYAYLVPALLSGGTVLVSTATKALQDQLFHRDIPRLRTALNLPLRVALLKGRSSYLCLQRLAFARQDSRANHPTAMRQLAQVERWAVTTQAGDLAELEVDEEASVVPLVTSTRENCLGARCPQSHNCHVNMARSRALAADVVVVNHHLFFADLNIRESGVAELLPTVRAVIFDEAHQLNDIGVQFLGRQLTTGQLAAFSRDLVIQGLQWARGFANWNLMVLDLDRAAAALRKLCGQGVPTGKRRWNSHAPQSIAERAWVSVMAVLRAVVQDAAGALGNVAECSPELKRLQDRATALIEKIDHFSHPADPGQVRWLESGDQVRLVESPLDIAEVMQSRVVGSDARNGGGKSLIFTSATLGGDDKMEWFVNACGLQGATLLQVESPFDYATQASLYIPRQMPKPSDSLHSGSVAMLAAQSAAVLGGRTLLLTTSLRALRNIGSALQQHFSQANGIEVLVQGQLPKRELLERFSLGSSGSFNGCILVASASFWEGVDVPGDALQMVIVDKLPFAPPGDPLLEARELQMESTGKNAFKHFQLPQAAMALKQGAGRLIRRETDRGVLVVCDVRLLQMGYGRKILAALPPMKFLTTREQFQDALHALTKPSTMDPCWT
ncbi:MAG: helicase [Burkholderiales bacterium RIFCSPLOWO2_12_FULL_61_40]|nr:MAG: helicase [Burkholderiales bacterium RIFCSPLOWO2_12_FULL_61_40]